MIEATLVCGPPHSGKTTWIAGTLASGAGTPRQVAVVPASREDDGGSRAREELGRCLGAIAGLRKSENRPGNETPERAYVEAGHRPDVRKIMAMLSEQQVLRANFALTEVVVVVNAADGLEQLQHDESLRFSVGLADSVAVASADCATSAQTATLAAALGWLNPRAEIVHTEQGRIVGCPESAGTPADVTVAACRTWEREPWSRPVEQTMELSGDMSWPQFSLWLDAVNRAHPNRVLKINGLIRTPNGPLALRSYGGVLARMLPAQPNVAQPGENSVLSFITRGLDPGLLFRSLTTLVPSSAPRHSPLKPRKGTTVHGSSTQATH